MKIATSLSVTLFVLAAITSCNRGFKATATDEAKLDTNLGKRPKLLGS
ncbi:MAG: hypothetical protein J5605_03260 [Bacteroidales bacterium]|nr:hypothetical protein [Bacteroidales bacterium]